MTLSTVASTSQYVLWSAMYLIQEMHIPTAEVLTR